MSMSLSLFIETIWCWCNVTRMKHGADGRRFFMLENAGNKKPAFAGFLLQAKP